MIPVISQEDIANSFNDGKCPFCDSDNIQEAIPCNGYDGYVTADACDSDGACKYCVNDDQDDTNLLMCLNCYKGYNFKTKEVITDRFLYSIDPGTDFTYNINEAIKLHKNFPNQAIVMAISAMESYFKCRFDSIIKSDSKYANPSKNYNFQNIKYIQEAYKETFDFDVGIILQKIDLDIYKQISIISAVRHLMIHCAGRIDKKSLSTLKLSEDHIGELVEVKPEDAMKSIKLIKNVIRAVEAEIDIKFKNHV